MTHSVVVRHNFETAHRLPELGGKCQNLHGHSWWCEITVAAPAMPDGTVVEFGALKARLREWIDTWLDHGAMLGVGDPLVPALLHEGSKVCRFGAADPRGPAESHAAAFPWPTVENVAHLLANVAQEILAALDHAPAAGVTRVTVHETHVNSAQWSTT